MIYTVWNQVNVFDALVSLFGNSAIDNAIAFCVDNGLGFGSENDFSSDMSSDFSYNNTGYLPVGAQLTYIPAPTQPPAVVAQLANNTPQNLDFVARYGQNTFDTCLNMYGTLDTYIKSLLDNELDSEYEFNNTSLSFTPSIIPDVNIYNRTTAVGVFFSTGNSSELDMGEEGDYNSDWSTDFTNQGS